MAKDEPEKGPIQIRIPRDLEAACERVRARGGDRSRDKMIARLVTEADRVALEAFVRADLARIDGRRTLRKRARS